MAISKEYNEYLKSDKWRKKRSLRLKIDNYTCQKCGSGRNLNVHHLNYKHLGNENVYDDLITLCETCHAEIEKRKKNEIPAAIGVLQQTDNVEQEVSSSFPQAISGGWIYSGIYYSKMPVDEFLINRSSRVVDGEAYHVYYKHNCHTDTLIQSTGSMIFTAYFEYDIVPKQGHIEHIVCKAEITNKGAFAFYPKSVQYLYKDGTAKNVLCDGCELLYDDGAALEIFNITSPHPGCRWIPLRGSITLHKKERTVVKEFKPSFSPVEKKEPEKKKEKKSIASEMAIYLVKLVLIYGGAMALIYIFGR